LVVVLLILLGQGVVSMGYGMRPVLHMPVVGSTVDGAVHACEHEPENVCGHHGGVRLFPWSGDGEAAGDCGTDCCPCPHLHLQIPDSPLSAGEARGEKESAPGSERITVVPVAEAPWESPVPTSKRGVGQRQEHPPPRGLLTMKLRI
jgi:hypothetical protein